MTVTLIPETPYMYSRTIITHANRVTNDPSLKSQKQRTHSIISKNQQLQRVLLTVISFLTSDTTSRVVEGHLKSLEVQFQQIIE